MRITIYACTWGDGGPYAGCQFDKPKEHASVSRSGVAIKGMPHFIDLPDGSVLHDEATEDGLGLGRRLHIVGDDGKPHQITAADAFRLAQLGRHGFRFADASP